MALQDLTPQLRTRLSRMERAVGLFVALAIGLLGFGFAYYVYNTAKRKGWFLTKAPYYTFIDRATGLKVGDPVTLMGRDAGRIIAIEPMPADQFEYNIYVQFELRFPHYGYMWTEGSFARVATADLLGKRGLEVTKGTGGYPTYVSHPLREILTAQAGSLPDTALWLLGQELYDVAETNLLAPALAPLTNLNLLAASGKKALTVLDSRESHKGLTGIWDYKQSRYLPFTKQAKGYWLLAEESPAVSERLENVIGQIEAFLPGVFTLTNQLLSVLSNASELTGNLNSVVDAARPGVSNLTILAAELGQRGRLGELLLPTNLNQRLEATLGNAGTAFGTANTTLETASTNLVLLAQNLNRSLDSLASITSNLNNQVEANTNILGAISQTLTDADKFIQGLQRHWLLRSAFRQKPPTNPPPPRSDPLESPKASGEKP